MSVIIKLRKRGDVNMKKFLSIAIVLILVFIPINYAYSDVAIDSPYYYVISKLVEFGILENENKFNPDDYVTKAEVSEMVYNTIQYIRKEENEKFENIASKLQYNIGVSCFIDSIGSGVAISEHLVLTAYHVIAPSIDGTCQLKLSNYYETQTGTIVYTDEENDLALVYTKAELNVINISKDNVNLLDEVYAIGNPIIFENLITVCRISGTDIKIGGYKNSVVSVDADFNNGNSGGMVLNKDGELVGIVLAKIDQSYGTGIGFIAKLDTIKDFIGKYEQTQR